MSDTVELTADERNKIEADPFLTVNDVLKWRRDDSQ